MDAPLTQWYCDECGDAIAEINNGYVLWNPNGSREGGFRIIHQGKCDRKEYFNSAALADFVGDNGAARLLSMLSYGPIRKGLGQVSTPKLPDLDEFVDFFRRVQTPHYEEAPRLFSEQTVLEDFSDASETSPYLSDRLKRIISEHE